MGARQILGDRTNVKDVVKRTKADAKLNSEQRSEPITITSGSESDTPLNLMPKAYQLNQLAEQVSKAADNPAISQLVRQFIGVLKINSSRTLTREAFHFLDKLYKQLDDPSVFIKAKKWVGVGHVLTDSVLTTFKGHRRRGHLVNKCRKGSQVT